MSRSLPCLTGFPGQRHTLLAAAAMAVVAGMAPAHARTAGQVEFNSSFSAAIGGLDVSRFSHGNPLEAGVYNVDVRLNGEPVRRMDITFVDSDTPHAAQPCLPASLLRELGLKDSYLLATDETSAPECVALEARVDGAHVRYDDHALQLDLSIPQAALQRDARGLVPANARDAGVNAGFVNYNANHYRSHGTASSFLGLDTGINLGAWRLRHRSSFSHSNGQTGINVIGSALQRELPRWNSQLLLGQGTTGGELFDGLPFTGARVASDERMLPDSLRGYAPVVRGLAQGNARVTVRQGGSVVYETTVPPGPFAIDDLYATTGGGDLEVTVTEADGREDHFTVAFSAVPQALREGMQRFSATVGALRDTGGTARAPRFAEATYARGLSNHLTVLGGLQLASGYQATLAGAALNTRFGAFGADLTHARSRLPGAVASAGQSYRFNYQRSIASTGTNLGLAAYRYSTEGYLTLSDAAQRAQDDRSPPGAGPLRTRNRLQLNIYQRLGERSQLYLTGGHTGYWDQARSSTDLQLGLYSNWKAANYNVSATRYRMPDGRPDTRLAFSVRLPLGQRADAPRLSSSVNHSDLGQQYQLGMNGVLGDNAQLNYSLAASRGEGGAGYDGYASYLGGRGSLSAGYSRRDGGGGMNVGASGSVVLHGGGVNLGNALGDSFALVHAEGAQGARVQGGRRVTVAGNGYAVVPYTTPYRWNTLDLDTSRLPLDVEVEGGSQRVAPTAGSIAKVTFAASRERTLFIDTTDGDAPPLPFAAAVSGEDGRLLGHVGQGGVIALRGAQAAGSVWVALGQDQRCRLDYALPAHPDAQGLYWTQARCVAPPATATATSPSAIPFDPAP